MTPARLEFERLFRDMGLATSDAAWLVFLNGWNCGVDRAVTQINKFPFEPDTKASFSIYIGEIKE
jgi:hypothetical protein